jgi:hypothetical protein
MPQANGLRKTIGMLDPACPPASWWKDIVGSYAVPLKTCVPRMDKNPDTPESEPELFYDVDVAELTEQQITEIAEIISREFKLELRDVLEGVRGAHGIPVRAQHLTTVIFDGRHFL